MIRARQLATAFLLHGDDLLMMRRSSDAALFPGMYAPVGGRSANPGATRYAATLKEVSQ